MSNEEILFKQIQELQKLLELKQNTINELENRLKKVEQKLVSMLNLNVNSYTPPNSASSIYKMNKSVIDSYTKTEQEVPKPDNVISVNFTKKDNQ